MAQPRWLDARQQHVWQAYLHLNQHLYAFLEQQLAGDGLSGADYKVLHPLSEAPEGLLRARELGSEIGWDRSRLSHHLTRMEKRGLIAREECSEDGRGLMVRLDLTPAEGRSKLPPRRTPRTCGAPSSTCSRTMSSTRSLPCSTACSTTSPRTAPVSPDA